MKIIRFSLFLSLTIVLVSLLNHRLFGIPPLGKFLDPFHGYLALVGSDELPRGNRLFSLLEEEVEIIWDEHRIPHIFAKNDHDLYFAQGYVMAFERLWQMEFQTHSAAGRMSEIIGKKAVKYDMFQRRIGMTYGAKNSLETIQKDKDIWKMVQAFTNGVNAYIQSLDKNKFPIEYKILDYSPELWTPIKVSFLLKNMAWVLTGRSSDLVMTRMVNKFGKEIVDELFPSNPPWSDPIIPTDIPFDFQSVPLKIPKTFYEADAGNMEIMLKPDERNGSNNWVVSGSRISSGNTVLANDPHLSLSLPSIWYQMHLVSPTQNVAGVTIPGAPGIIIGFNENIAWGVTNGNDDVMDWYDIQFKDDDMNEYWHDGKWKLTRKVIEEIKIRGEEAIWDTITFTHHGPVVWEKQEHTLALGSKNIRNSVPQTSVGRAVRWLAHDRTNEMRTFYELNHADNYEDFVEALRYFTCPSQNFVYTDLEGNIALWHSGNYPAKWKDQGKFISDGTNPVYDWQVKIPHYQKPHVLNPKRGYLSSANQHPTNENYPYYLDHSFWPSYRAKRINERLKRIQMGKLEDIRDIQLDNVNIFTRSILPVMLVYLENEKLTKFESELFDQLIKWDYAYVGDSHLPTIFDHWMKLFKEMVWSDEFSNRDQVIQPRDNILEDMVLHRPYSKWFDDIRTENKEDLKSLCRSSFHQAVEELSRKYNLPVTETWNWQNHRGTNLSHLANIPGFGKMNLETSGGMYIPNATGKNFGPSWRYAVEMGNILFATGIYPGGQSGYPGSLYYDDFVYDWVEGNYNEIYFPRTTNEITGTHLQLIKQENE